MARKSNREARELLLDTAVDVFLEHLGSDDAVAASLSSVGFPEITARAGYRSPGIVYHLWGSGETRSSARDNFELDLLRRLAQIASANTGVDLELADPQVVAQLSFQDIVRLVAETTWTETAGSPTHRIHEILMALRRSDTVRSEFATAEVDALDTLAAAMAAVVELSGRTWKPGLSARHLAIATRALLDGLIAAEDLTPDFATTEAIDWTGAPATLYAVCCDTLAMGMTEPANR